ncbi:hypothetical protein L208DRAFT_1543179, partial [Tricholoma matsutake]
MPKRRTRGQPPHRGLRDPILITGDIFDDDVQDYDTRFVQDESEVAAALKAARDLWAREDLSDPNDDDDDDSLVMQEALIFAKGGPRLSSRKMIDRVRWAQGVDVKHRHWACSLPREDMYSQELGIAELLYLEASPAPLLPWPPIPELVEDEVPLSRDQRLEIEATSDAMLHLLDMMTSFVGTVRVSAVPLNDRNSWHQMAWELFTTTWQFSGSMMESLCMASAPLDLMSPAAFQASYAAMQAARSEPQSGNPCPWNGIVVLVGLANDHAELEEGDLPFSSLPTRA